MKVSHLIKIFSWIFILNFLVNEFCVSQEFKNNLTGYTNCSLVNIYETKKNYYEEVGIFSPKNKFFLVQRNYCTECINLISKEIYKLKPCVEFNTINFIEDNVISGESHGQLNEYNLLTNNIISQNEISTPHFTSKLNFHEYKSCYAFNNKRNLIAKTTQITVDTKDSYYYKWIVEIRGYKNIDLTDYGEKKQRILDLSFSYDDKYIAAGGEASKVVIWETATGNKVKTLNFKNNITSVCFHPEGNLLVCGDESGNIHIVNTHDWSIINTIYQVSSNSINDLSFDPNGNFLACATGDGLYLVNLYGDWNTPYVVSKSKNLSFLSFSSDGTKLIVGEKHKKNIYQYQLEKLNSLEFVELLNQKTNFLNNQIEKTETTNHVMYYAINTSPLIKIKSKDENNLELQFEQGLKIKFAENSTDSSALLKISRPKIYPDIVNSLNYYPVSSIYEINCALKDFNRPFQIGLKLTENNLTDQDSVFVGRIENGKLELLSTTYNEETNYYFAESNSFSYWGLFRREKPRFKFITTTPYEYSGIEPRGIRDFNQCDNCYTDDLRTENFKEDLLIKCGVIDVNSKVNKARLKLSIFGNVEWAYDMIQKVALSYANVGYNRIIAPAILNKNQAHQSFYIDTYSVEGKTEDGRTLDYYDFTITKESLANILCTVGWINKLELQVLLLNDDDKVITNSKTITVHFHTKTNYNNRPQISLIYPDYDHADAHPFFLWDILNKQNNSVDIDYQLGDFKLYVDTDDNPFDGGWLAFEDDKTSMQLKDYYNDEPIRVYYRNHKQKLMNLQRYYWGVSITKHGSKNKKDIVYSGIKSFQVRHTTQVYSPQKDEEWIFQKYLPMQFIVKWDYVEYKGNLKIDIVKSNDPYHNPVFSISKYVTDGSVNITEEVRSVSSRFPIQDLYKVRITFSDLPSLTQGYSEQFTIKNPYTNQSNNETYVQETEPEEKMTDGEFLMQLAGSVLINHVDKKISESINNYQNDYSSGQNSSVKQEGTNIPDISGTWFDAASGYKLRVISQNGTICKGSFSHERLGESWVVNIHIVDTYGLGHQVQKAPWIKVNSGGRYCIWFDVNAGFNLVSGIFSCTLSNSGNTIYVNNLYKRIMKDGSLTIRTGEFKPVKWSSKFSKIN